jgi:hypothetical protein
VDTDVSLVRRLLAAQFPQWADLHIAPVPSAGTDNALYRLGEDMAVRLPRIDWAVKDVEQERRWLPRLAPHLPLAIPRSRWRWGRRARVTSGIGLSTGGSTARTRPPRASLIYARRRVIWRISSPPCDGLILTRLAATRAA